jgi:hypothetical protein
MSKWGLRGLVDRWSGGVSLMVNFLGKLRRA